MRLTLPRIAFTVLTMAALSSTSLFAADNTLTAEEKSAGWELLFDGKTLDGWKIYKGQQPENGKNWKAEEGVLSLAKPGGGDLVTEKQFENFELALDFKISEGGNSGLMFHVVDTDGPSYYSGPEIQILDDARNQREAQKSGYLYQMYKPAEGVAPFKADEWNSYVIHIDSKNGSWVKLNGVKLYDFEIGSDDWKKRLESTKFKAWKDFAAHKSGSICLQDHGDVVSFRNIKVRELK